ncbi:hypothetical protein GS448_15805 [Rhodococcus hoagii]|nr:hypothetical protein [Prescottella equi]MBM4668514.1 hypothetical protein [Prescottella equi]NKV88756.1 hypothetical protein [Prescottella equi]
MLETLNSPAGLYWLYSLAFIFQLAGVVLVVRDIRRARQNDLRLRNNLHNISKAWNDIPDMAREISRAGGDDSTAAIFEPSIATDLKVNGLMLVVNQIIGHSEASKEPNRWVAALGPISLCLGIVLGFAASMFAIA